jgi:hypothetical protein
MRKLSLILVVSFIMGTSFQVFSQSESERKAAREKAANFTTKVDNNRYWIQAAEKGYTRLNPVVPVPAAKYTGSNIDAFSVVREDSPDIPVTDQNSTQSETSIFVNPNDIDNVLNSNNSTQNPVGFLYGANDFYSFDGGETWDGELEGAGGSNSGDPAALIGTNGWYYIGYISDNLGQGVSYSQDEGQTWTAVNVANPSGFSGILDKNHLWIDNSTSSPYEGHLYDAWTSFGGSNDNDIELARSINGGISWESPVNISSAVAAGSHCQGVNINTGPDGEVYAVWSIYDSWPIDENAIGMARSFDGGETWEPAFRIIDNTRGIRNSTTSKNHRVNSFPVMAVDISNSQYRGNIYIVWANIGVPGINTGSDIDIYMIRSEDRGDTWSEPVRVNQDEPGLGKQHYFPWITCDPENGILSVIYYDDRNVGGNQVEVFCANSFDAGETWEDFKVSDVAFTPAPIPGLAGGYMGDYLGISARGGKVYPVWPDNRTGTVMSYVSPYETNALPRPSNLTAEVEFETGNCTLDWSFETAAGFQYFNIYREEQLIGTTADTSYTDILPDYGFYDYAITAYFDPDGESSSVGVSVQWGDAHIEAIPESITETLLPDSSATRMITVTNTGQLDLHYDLTIFIPDGGKNPSTRDYCSASGGCDEYISRVQFGDIDNQSQCTNYGDYTNLSTVLYTGTSQQLTVTNGNPIYSSDQCGVWIDWNGNEDFTDDEPVNVNGSPGVGPYTATIEAPDNAVPGPTRMRIRIVYFGNPQPCGNTTYGEAEDYTIQVLSWLRLSLFNGSISPGGNNEIEVILDAQGLAVGTYNAEIQIGSNDPDLPEIIVPVTLNVVDMAASIDATQEELCNGDTTVLTAVVTGGSGDYTYSWTSTPEGFTSDQPQVEVAPNDTTIYHLEVSDGSISAESEVSITVNQLPILEMEDVISMCEGDSVMLDAGEGHFQYMWNTGDTSRTIMAKEAGVYSVLVMNEAFCATEGEVEVTHYQQPVVELGQDTLLCYNYEIEFDAENPGSTYLWSTGDTSRTVMVDTTGMAADQKTIWVEVTNEDGCTTKDTIHIDYKECLSIVEWEPKDLRIYPNPNEGRFFMEFNLENPEKLEITLTGEMGRVVLRETRSLQAGFNKEVLAPSIASDGIYYLSITSDKGTYTEKIMIRR